MMQQQKSLTVMHEYEVVWFFGKLETCSIHSKCTISDGFYYKMSNHNFRSDSVKNTSCVKHVKQAYNGKKVIKHVTEWQIIKTGSPAAHCTQSPETFPPVSTFCMQLNIYTAASASHRTLYGFSVWIIS